MPNYADLPDDIDSLKALLLASEPRVAGRGSRRAMVNWPSYANNSARVPPKLST